MRHIYLPIAMIAVCQTALAEESAQTGQVDTNAQDLTTTTFTAESSKVSPDVSANSKLLASPYETPRAIDIITKEQFTERGAQSIQDAIGYTSGVLAGPFGFDSRLDSARVRGLSPLSFHDGFQQHFGYYNNTRADIYMLEQVEVIKGPASVLYGRGAVGGIINSVSKLPNASEHKEVNLQYGTYDRRQIGVDFTGALNEEGTLLYRLVGLYRRSGTQVDWVRDDAAIFMPSITWQPSDDTSLTFLMNFQDNDGGQTLQFLPNEGTLLPGKDIGSETFIGEPGWDRYDTNQNAYSVMFDHRFNDTFSLSANARYMDSKSKYYSHWVAYGPSPTIQPDGTVGRTLYASHAKSETWSANTTLHGNFEYGAVQHKMRFGADFVDNTLDNDTAYGLGTTIATGGAINIYNPVYGNLSAYGPLTDNPETSQQQVGIFLHNHFTFDKWIVSLGARHDDLKSDDGSMTTKENEWTFDAGLMYQFDNGIAPYYSYAESFEPLGFDTTSNQQLKPKYGEQHEVGVKYRPAFADALFTASVFDIKEKNRPVGSGPTLTQSGEVSIQGAELELKTRYDDFYFQTAYTYLDTADESLPGEPRLATVPENQASAWVTYDPAAGKLEDFRTGFGVRYVGKNWDGSDSLHADDYTLFDAMIGYTWGDVDIQLNINNLFDKEFVATTQGGRSYYGARRTVNLSASYNF
ncbi:TonB-dependent siderophore receptor [Rubritalea spongiae]|uniref:TonB-dependent siderophore receptor n=1 Tax=Rubritalea spongiae TaxID=430797 RepID=A0ABW5E961_9BACT